MKATAWRLFVLVSMASLPTVAVDMSYWRVSGSKTSVITDVSADGHLAWTNAASNQIEFIQTTASLEPADWRHYTSVLATGTVVSYRVLKQETPDYLVIDLSEGSTATNYAVSYLDGAPPGGWDDAYKTTKLVLRRIPAGTFTMGSATNQLGRSTNEVRHQVTLTRDFYIGVFEVTQKQWERVMGAWQGYFGNITNRDSRPVELVSYYVIRENGGFGAISPHWPQSSQVHSNSFMGRLRAKTGLETLDLPTESQWEYACRAGTVTALNSGYDLINATNDAHMAEVGRYRWNHPGGYSTSSGVSTSSGTAKVGSYVANAWGLYDMHGNVSEFCLDWYGPYPGTVTDPPGVSSGTNRVSRGGGWASQASDCRSANRVGSLPYSQGVDVGLRVAAVLP